MIGRTLLHGPQSLANWSPQFFFPDQLCAFEVNARRRNSWTCNIWCQSTHRSRQPTHTRLTLSKSIRNKLTTARNTDQHRVTTITKRAIKGHFVARLHRALSLQNLFFLKFILGALFLSHFASVFYQQTNDLWRVSRTISCLDQTRRSSNDPWKEQKILV